MSVTLPSLDSSWVDSRKDGVEGVSVEVSSFSIVFEMEVNGGDHPVSGVVRGRLSVVICSVGVIRVSVTILPSVSRVSLLHSA